jgi:hypothetical protein
MLALIFYSVEMPIFIISLTYIVEMIWVDVLLKVYRDMVDVEVLALNNCRRVTQVTQVA